jgi:hypothetical protein
VTGGCLDTDQYGLEGLVVHLMIDANGLGLDFGLPLGMGENPTDVLLQSF